MTTYVPQLTPAGGINTAVEAADNFGRGAIVLRAQELESQLRAGTHLPFDRVIFYSLGNPQSLAQPPLTFLRQVLSGVVNPGLLDADILPADVCDRVHCILSECDGVGAYSPSKGIPAIRGRVASAIARRDGAPCDPDRIFPPTAQARVSSCCCRCSCGTRPTGCCCPCRNTRCIPRR